MDGRAGGGAAGDLAGRRRRGQCGVEGRVRRLALAQDALERGAGEPDKVAAGVHIQRDDGGRGRRADGDTERVVAPGGQREGDLLPAALRRVPVASVARRRVDRRRLEVLEDGKVGILGTGEGEDDGIRPSTINNKELVTQQEQQQQGNHQGLHFDGGGTRRKEVRSCVWGKAGSFGHINL